jgi:hypothetical protein
MKALGIILAVIGGGLYLLTGGGATGPDLGTTPGPFGNFHILTLPGSFLMIPIGAIWVLAVLRYLES